MVRAEAAANPMLNILWNPRLKGVRWVAVGISGSGGKAEVTISTMIAKKNRVGTHEIDPIGMVFLG